ncbi:ParA family protein [Candidatus Magnetominusculus dajiuhuensis]|uniref:ParA family protein n=1 Tax=Candidatus Magnetominusculus dajiuhuensis TaxID=3137712 RepID=UPI003B428E56
MKTARIIAITNQKGGVGKTTTAVNLAAGLNKMGMRTLLVDIDSQGNASASLGLIIEHDIKTIKDLLLNPQNPRDFIARVGTTEIIPSNNSLKDIEDTLIIDKKFDTLKDSIAPLANDYEYIIIDCPPSVNVFTNNALKASNEIIIPVDVGYFSLLGLKQLLEEIERFRRELNPRLEILGVLACRYDRRTSLSAQIFETLRQGFPDKLFNTYIRLSIDIVRAQIAQKNIFDYNNRGTAARDYNSLTEEIINGK